MKFRNVLPVVIVMLAVVARLVPGPRTIDDSYITFRYARNILVGDGFVYNPGERVLGTTTPLYTGVMVILGAVSGGPDAPFAQLAWLLNAGLDGLTCLLLLKLGKQLNVVWAGRAAAVVWAVLPYSVTFAIGGLETSLLVLLMTGAMLSFIQSRFTAASGLAAAAMLTRPDALLLIGPLVLARLLTAENLPFYRMTRQQNPSSGLSWQELAVFGLPGLAWALFAWGYFGSPLPHSITAKAAAYRLDDLEALIRFLQHYAAPFMAELTFGARWIMLGLFLYPFLFLVGSRALVRQSPQLWPWLIYPWLYFGVYAAANPLVFRWYLTPPLPAYIFGILAGLQHILGLAAVKSAPTVARTHWSMALRQAAMFVPVLFVLNGWEAKPDHGLGGPAPQMAWYELELTYRQAAASLRADPSIRPDAVLAAGDVGVLGFDTDLPILDTVGLISPEAVAYYPTESEYYVNAYAISPDLILDHKPDLVILLEVYAREGLFKNGEFLESYRLREKIDTTIYGSDGMLIFERVVP
jgi:hypothetical protein